MMVVSKAVFLLLFDYGTDARKEEMVEERMDFSNYSLLGRSS